MNRPFDSRGLLRGAALACVVALAVLSLVPGDLRPHVFHDGNLEHLVAYAGTAFLLTLGFGRRTAWMNLSWLSAASAVFELLQIWIPGRTPSLDNWVASSTGAMIGTLAAIWTARLLARRLA